MFGENEMEIGESERGWGRFYILIRLRVAMRTQGVEFGMTKCDHLSSLSISQTCPLWTQLTET